VVRILGHGSRGPVYDTLRYQIFCEIIDLKLGVLSLMRIIEELLE
jgi:hypothetical protein